MDFEGIGDLVDLFGVVLPEGKEGKEVSCGGKPPRVKPKRNVEWNNLTSFKFNGYVAKVTESTCEMCGAINRNLEGIFTEELHLPTNTRRLTALSQGAQWPANETHRLEVERRFTPICGHCISELGFGMEVETPKQFSLEIKE